MLLWRGSRGLTRCASGRRYLNTTTSPDLQDVVILGGGPIGLALAAALRAKGETSNLKICLVESQDLEKNAGNFRSSVPSRYSNRCSSVTPATISFLKDIRAWDHVKLDRLQPYSQMNVWDGVSGQSINFNWSGSRQNFAVTSGTMESSISGSHGSGIACMTENPNLVSALLTCLESGHASERMTILQSTKVENITLGEDNADHDLRSWPILRLSNGRSIAARLLVGADGPNSIVRGFADIDSHGWDYERHGVVATLSVNAPDAIHAAYQRFLPTGPCALLPLPNGLMSMVWTTTPKNASLLKKLGQADLLALINAAFRLSSVDLEYMHSIPELQANELSWRLQHSRFDPALVPPEVVEVQDGTLASFPLRMRHADAYTAERVALIGDAAHTVHPLAGQGLNLGMADAKSLAEVVASAAAAGADIGSTISLEQYATERYLKNHAMLGAVDKLHKLYSTQWGPVVAARSLGLGFVDRFGGLKELFMKQAAGM